MESILKPDPSRFNLFPIKHQSVYDFYKKAQKAIWEAEEIPYNADKMDWDNKLNANERYFIKNVLAFFAGSDGIVLENIMSTFSVEVQWPEARLFYGLQSYMEGVHSETYSMLIDTLVTDTIEKEKLFTSIETIPCIAEKAKWAIKWMNSTTTPFCQRLVGFIIVEGLFFSGSFCAIFWLISRGLMTKALGKSNELIARDEGVHVDFGILLYNLLETKCPELIITKMFRDAVEVEKNFICSSIPNNMLGMNKNLMATYIEYVADSLLTKLSCPPIYGVECPFNFMNLINMQGKTNFFEARVTEYQRPWLVSTMEQRENIDYEGDF